jgi:hypothetical protein
MATRGHPQTKVDYHGREISVDTKMVALLRACWAQGIETHASCEDAQHGSARIWFADEDSYLRFRLLVPGVRVNGSHWPVDFLLRDAEAEFL